MPYSIPTYMYQNPIEQYLRDRQAQQGFINVCFYGDSLVAGSSNNMGYRLAFLLALQAMGFNPVTVGDITDSASTARFLVNGASNMVKHHAVGGTTTANLINGTGGFSSTWASFIGNASYQADLYVGSHGTNDTSPGVRSEFETVFQTIYANNPSAIICHINPPTSVNQASDFYTADASRLATGATIRAASVSSATGARPIIVEPDQALGRYSWYPLDSTPLIPESTNTVAETVTFAHQVNWPTGTEVIPSATVGGLTSGTTYYLNNQGGRTFSFHTSRANALSNTSAVNLTANITQSLVPTFVNQNQNNSSWLFQDSTHPTVEANAIIVSGAIAALFGKNQQDILNYLTAAQPYAPEDWSFGRALTAGSTYVMQAPGRRRTTLTSFYFNNAAAGASVITISKRRASPDLSTVSEDFEVMSISIPASDDGPIPINLTAHYGEGLVISAATSDITVYASGQRLI